MKPEVLFVVNTENMDAVFDALGKFAKMFENSDGKGPYLAPYWVFPWEGVLRARRRGARLVLGWAVEYPGGDPKTSGPWCGYNSTYGTGVAYTLDREVAQELEEYASRARQGVKK